MLVAGGVLLGGYVAVEAAAVERLVVFGDSLSDPGNLHAVAGIPESPPYYQGRFSNGPVWVEAPAEILEIDPASVHNHAFGGAKTGTTGGSLEEPPGFLDEVGFYLHSAGPIAPETLHDVWIGANDSIASDKFEKDPLFLNAEQLDFRLRKGSPAIDAAGPNETVATDLKGVPRPQGGGHDIGAHEDR